MEYIFIDVSENNGTTNVIKTYFFGYLPHIAYYKIIIILINYSIVIGSIMY